MKIVERITSCLGMAALVLALVAFPARSLGAVGPGPEATNNCKPAGDPGSPADVANCSCSPAGCCSADDTVWNATPSLVYRPTGTKCGCTC